MTKNYGLYGDCVSILDTLTVRLTMEQWDRIKEVIPDIVISYQHKKIWIQASGPAGMYDGHGQWESFIIAKFTNEEDKIWFMLKYL